MKNILISICLLFLLTVSCTDTEVLDSTFTLEVKGFVEEKCYTFGEEQPLYLWASKNWADNRLSEVTYEVAPEVLESYNATEGTSYQLLPESCYRFTQDSFSVDDESQLAKFKMMYSPEQIIAEGGSYGTIEYALPVRILVNGVPMEDRYGSVIVGFNVNKAVMSITNPLETTMLIDPAVSQEVAMTFEVNYDNIEWIQLGFTVNGDLVEEYNQAHGTSYLPFPMEDVSWLTEEFELEREVDVDSALFYADMINLDQTKRYLLAIRLDSVSTSKCQIDPEHNTRYVIFSNPRIPQSKWRVSTKSTKEGAAANLVDDDPNTFWMWNYDNNDLPEDITFMLKDMSELAVIEKIQLFARQYNNSWAGPKDMEIYVTKDGDSWEKIKDYTVALGADGKVNTEGYYIEFDEPVECLGYRIRITSYYDNGIGFMEIYTEGSLIENPNPPASDGRIDQGAWTVTTSTTSSGSPANLNDYDEATFWLWKWSNYQLPGNITYTLTDQTQTATVEAIEVYAYNTGNPGWKGAQTIEVQVQTDGETWTTIQTYNVALKDDGMANTDGYKIELSEPVQCKAIRLSVTEVYSDGLAFGEIYINGELTTD